MEHSEIDTIDISDEKINKEMNISDSCDRVLLQVNTTTEQCDLREIEIIDLCDEELHQENSILNSCDVVEVVQSNISFPQDDIITKVLGNSTTKQTGQVSFNNSCLVKKLSEITDKLTIPIDGKLSVCAGFDQLMNALSISSSNSSSVVMADGSNNNNLKHNSPVSSLPDLNTLLTSNCVSLKVSLLLRCSIIQCYYILILFTFRKRFTAKFPS